jgi:hypothetical protein
MQEKTVFCGKNSSSSRVDSLPPFATHLHGTCCVHGIALVQVLDLWFTPAIGRSTTTSEIEMI